MELKPLFKDIADAIREKDGTTNEIKAADFPERIRVIQGGGGGIELESISIVTPPATTKYQAGEFFDPTGLEIQAVYTNGAMRDAEDYTVTPSVSTPLTTDDTKIVIQLTECGTTKTVEYPISVSVLPVKKPLNDMTWAEIRQVSDVNLGAEYWNVGDRKSVTIKGIAGTLSLDTTLYVYILGFNHNAVLEGSGIQFGMFKTALSGGTDVCLVDGNYTQSDTSGAKRFNMNHWGDLNYGGWKASDLRYDILGSTNKAPDNYGKQRVTADVGCDAPVDTATNPVANTLMAALPADLRAVMKPMTKYTDNKGGSSNTAVNVTGSVDYLPLLAEFEIWGTRTYANQYEQNYQVQYAYYKAGNSKLKYKHSATTSGAYCWERSAIYSYGNSFCMVDQSGRVAANSARNSYGLAPVFMV